MNAIIIYDTLDYVMRATATLERVTHQADETIHWVMKPWRVDVLKMPPALEAALAEAMEARLIMFAVSRVESLLNWLSDWLEQWARNRRIQEAALAIWDSGSLGTRLAQVPLEKLSRFATSHGLRLIFDDNALIEHKSAQIASNLQKQERLLVPTHQGIVEQPMRDDCRHWQHWGINE
jgi:hypothetical protein